MKKTIKYIMRDYVLVATISIIIINIVLIYWAFNATEDFWYYIIFVGGVIVNSYYLFRFKLSAISEDEWVNETHNLKDTVYLMEYAKPLNNNMQGYNLRDKQQLSKEYIHDASKKAFDKIQGSENTIFNEVDEPNESIEFSKDKSFVKPKETIESYPEYNASLDCYEYTENMMHYMKDNGLNISLNTIREMFASLASTKLIILSNQNSETLIKFTELFSKYIGAKLFNEELLKEETTFTDLLCDQYEFKDRLIATNAKSNEMNFMTLNEVNLTLFQEGFSEVIDFSLNPLIPLKLDKRFLDQDIYLKPNTWFFIIPKNYDQSYLKNRLMQSAIILDVEAGLGKTKETINQNEIKLSYQNMMNIISEGSDQYFLEEEDWKKFDQIEHYLNKRSSFTLDNRLFRQLERYISTFLMFGGDKKEVYDRILFSKILPLTSTINLDINQKSEEDILTLFEKLFGLEYLNKSKNLLKIITTSMS